MGLKDIIYEAHEVGYPYTSLRSNLKDELIKKLAQAEASGYVQVKIRLRKLR